MIVATPDHMHAADRLGRDEPRQARLRAEADVLVGARGAAPREEGARQSEDRDADGQPASFGGQLAARHRVRPGRRARRDPRSACLDESAARVLAAGRAAAGTVVDRSGAAAVGQPRRDAAARRGDGRPSGSYPVPDKLSWDLFLGVAPLVEYHPLYHPFNWRGWVDWGQGALGDMGAHLMDFPGLVAESWPADRDRDRVRRRSTASATRTRRRRYFQFPGAQGPACGQADVVRRRPDAARSRGARERDAGSERRRALRREEGEAAALQRRAPGCCRRRSTIPTARRRSASRACRTAITR